MPYVQQAYWFYGELLGTLEGPFPVPREGEEVRVDNKLYVVKSVEYNLHNLKLYQSMAVTIQLTRN